MFVFSQFHRLLEAEGAGGGSGSGEGDKGGSGNGGATVTQLTAEQLTAALSDPKVLENSALWDHPRIKELRVGAAEAKTLKKQQEEAANQKLSDEKKFEELATKKGEELTAAQAKIADLHINGALTNVLVKEGVIDLDGALKLADRSKIKIADDGTITGVDDALNALKTEKAYLFNTESGKKTTVGGPTNPGNGNGGTDAPAKFKVSQLNDPAFYKANRDEILKAHAAGLIEDDTR